MQKKHCLALIVLAAAMAGSVDAKGPQKTNPTSREKGYSGKGVPSPSKSSKLESVPSRVPTQTQSHSKYTGPGDSRPASPGTTRKPSVGTPGGTLDTSSSKYSKQRPSYPPVQSQNPAKQPVNSQPVQFPSRPTFSKPGQPTIPAQQNPAVAALPSKSKPIYQRPPTVIYPHTSKKPPVTTPPNTTLPEINTRPEKRPAGPIVTSPKSSSRPTTLPSQPTWNSDRKKPYYPGLRPPVQQPPNQTVIVNRPTTVINQNNTSITNTNVTNVNSWFNSDAWKNNVTINSRNWNGRPWWYNQDYDDWHHGHWHGRYYFQGRNSWSYVNNDDHEWLSGLVAWGLGNMVYRSGYQLYVNPYYSRPIAMGSTTINYSRPICVQQSQYEILYANDEARAEQLKEQAVAYFNLARNTFRLGNASLSFDYINEAIALMPDDTALHEFRALVLFSVGDYSEAAEAIHAVLAVAPGWDWTTMSGLYYTHDVYTEQLRRLEEFVRLNPRSADSRFLLAYHYITMGYPEYAVQQLQTVLFLNPDDRLAADLLSLVRKENQQQDQFAALRFIENGTTQLEGRWIARRPDGEILLNLGDGIFAWEYGLQENNARFSGKYEMTGNMLLLATEEGSQMVGTVSRPDDDRFNFRLLGSNENDPGVEFFRR